MHTDIKNEKNSSFLEFYLKSISPKLKEIDLFVKTSVKNFDVKKSSEVLDLTLDEIKKIMQAENINHIDRHSFFKIMYNGSSEICKLYKRELDCGSPYTYTRRDISYIYNLELSKVNEVCDKLRIKEATSFTLPDIFAEISV